MLISTVENLLVTVHQFFLKIENIGQIYKIHPNSLQEEAKREKKVIFIL